MSTQSNGTNNLDDLLSDSGCVKHCCGQNGTGIEESKAAINKYIASILQEVNDKVIGEDEKRHDLNPSMNEGIIGMVREENYLKENRNDLRTEQRAALAEISKRYGKEL